MAASPPRLAASLAELEVSLRERLWRGAQPAPSQNSIASGFESLDAQLPGGGWPSRCLTELLLEHSGIGEIRLLAPALQALSAAGRQIVLLLPASQDQVVLPAGWQQLGIDPRHLLIIQAQQPADRLWALEQTLKSASFGALLAFADPLRPEALRRLQVAAAKADGLSVLFRPEKAQHHASAAPLRLLLQPSHKNGLRRLSVRILKRRGPVLGAPLLLDVATPRPLRVAQPRLVPAPPHVISSLQRHAVGRPVLSHPAARSHSAPTA